jgi:hypothetical protein
MPTLQPMGTPTPCALARSTLARYRYYLYAYLQSWSVLMQADCHLLLLFSPVNPRLPGAASKLPKDVD